MMRPVTGTTVGHYEVLEKLGEGGMGLVYRARDLVLNRVVALKFLPVDHAGADDKRRRFVQEAQAASALNHPNIITIYEVGNVDGRDYIAMELVPGRSLDTVIGGKALPPDTAVAYAIQIADALSAAHAAGIVHRDLKPGNVMLTDAGRIKVLDFGLAKLVTAPGGAGDDTQTRLEAPRTAEGTIVGTVSYMSPEQAEGKPVDQTSDVFSFGALMHEMLTGRRAFQGDSAVSTMAAILTADPAPPPADVPGVPADLARIVGRCLRKAPSRRWQSMADVRISLEELEPDRDAGVPVAGRGSGRARRRTWMAAAGATLVTAAVVGAAAWWARDAPAPPELWRLRRLTADTGASLFPAISRDGKLVAYVSDRAGADTMDLWVQQIDGGDPVRLTRDLGYCQDPAFSPDGSRIVLQCGADVGSIYVVSTLGGLPKKLADGELPQFSPDGTRIAYVTAPRARARSAWIMGTDGTDPREIKLGVGLFGGPVWRPDGQGLFFIPNPDTMPADKDRDWYFVSADGATATPIGALARLKAAGLGLGSSLSMTAGGLLFTEGGMESTNIYRMPFDAGFQRASGDPVPVVVGSGLNFWPTAAADGRRMTFAIANNLSVNIWRAPVDAGSGHVSGEAIRVTSGLDPSLAPSPSRDGTRIAYLGGPLDAPEVRIRDIATGKETRLASAKAWSVLSLSPDGSMVAFSSDQRDNSAIYAVSAAGGVPKKICEKCGRPVEWSQDKTKIFFDGGGPKNSEIHVLDVATGATKPLLRHGERGLNMPHLSPDGRDLLYTMQLPRGARRVYVAPFTGDLVPEQNWTLLVDGANYERQPLWAPGGGLIYFLSERDGFRCVWAQRVDMATRLPVGEPFGAHHMHQTRYSLVPFADTASIGLSIAGGYLFYASFETQANVWLAERRAPRQ
jgi:Tol biopolymer transport system component/predicted Ser/Thr protein kinase